MNAPADIIHASAVATRIGRDWRTVLLTGPSGAGKSDMALRLMGEGWRLISDDYCEVWRSGDHAYVCAPDRIAGRIEARGLGIVASPQRPIGRVALVAECGQTPAERMPEAETFAVAGVSIPLIRLDIRPASASVLINLALRQE